MNRGARQLLTEASRLRGVCVAVVSGRDMDDLLDRVDAPGAYIVASHGLDIMAPGGQLVRTTPPLEAEIESGLLDEILASGLRVERKKHGIAIHWRGIPYEAIAPVADGFRQWASAEGLDVIEGRCVVEARSAGAGKEEAVRWLASAIGASQVMYAGDDVTDFGALQFAADRGRGVFVASSERAAPEGVTVVGSFRELFRLVRSELNI